MKSFESPCASTHDAPLKQRLGPAELSAPPTEHQMVPDSSHGPLRGPDTENLGGPYDHLLPLADPEPPSVTTLRRHPPCQAAWKGEAFRFLSSPEEGPPMTSSAEKGRNPNYKVRFRLKPLKA